MSDQCGIPTVLYQYKIIVDTILEQHSCLPLTDRVQACFQAQVDHELTLHPTAQDYSILTSQPE